MPDENSFHGLFSLCPHWLDSRGAGSLLTNPILGLHPRTSNNPVSQRPCFLALSHKRIGFQHVHWVEEIHSITLSMAYDLSNYSLFFSR